MLAAELIADDTFNILTLVAAILFAIAAVMAVLERAIVVTLTSAGLALFALAWFVVS
jgi:NADH:ubiquinone oxidoreductase subunit K